MVLWANFGVKKNFVALSAGPRIGLPDCVTVQGCPPPPPGPDPPATLPSNPVRRGGGGAGPRVLKASVPQSKFAGSRSTADPHIEGQGDLPHAVDLIRLIRQHHGDYFGIAVAGVARTARVAGRAAAAGVGAHRFGRLPLNRSC